MTKQINCQLSWIIKAHMIFDIIQKDHHFPPTKSRTDLNFLQNNNLSTSTAYIKINLFKLSTNFVYIVHITFYYCNYHFTERYPHGIFADGWTFVPTQGKKTKNKKTSVYRNAC